jgi:hypothetical protein
VAGTTYTRAGPVDDPIGRLANFARFAVDELHAIKAGLRSSSTSDPNVILADARLASLAFRFEQLAGLLEEYPTADE